jgi:V/A-type H+-transporting ATPase subunit I
MSRVEVVGYRPVLDDVLDALQRAGVLQVDAAPEGLATEAVDADDDRRRRLDEYAADARFVREFLGRYHTPDQPFAAFVSEKYHLDVKEFEAIDGGSALLHVYSECEEIADALASGEREQVRLTALVRDLAPWLDVRLQISQWTGTEHVALIAGTVPASGGPQIRAALREVTSLMSVAEFGGQGARRAWIVLAHREAVDEVRSALAATQFAEVSFAGLEDYPAEESARAQARIGELEASVAALKERARALSAEHYPDAVAIVEAVDSDIASVVVRERFGRTERAFVARGWVRSSREQELSAALDPWAFDLDVAFSEPTGDDEPPVELDNPWFVRPFEVLTDLYGRPQYSDLDPTPLLAPFFLLFFGLCIGDVGYGAALIAGAWLIKNRLDVAPGVKRFMDMLMFGGVSAMVAGVLTGSYFAFDPNTLPPVLKGLMLINPLERLMDFLVFMVALGIVQVFFGVGVSAYDSWRRGDPGTAIFEQMSTILFFALLGVSVALWGSNPAAGRAVLVVALLGTMLMQGRTIQASLGEKGSPLWDRALGWLWIAAMLAWTVSFAAGGPGWVLWFLGGATLVGLLAAKSVRRCVVSFLGGAYAVYGMSSFLGDVLSYTRLAALGLSGTLVGGVFNLLAGMVWAPAAGLWAQGGAGYLWAALIVVGSISIFVLGHTFNVVINLLGAFVHPARLQFVEFFSKFYEGGGRPLKAFSFVTKSVVLEAGAVRQEGGIAS